MGLPGVVENVLDGNLNLQAGSNSNLTLFMDVCTLGVPNTLTTYGDVQTMTAALGAGSLLESAGYAIKAANPPVMVMPMTPSVRGGVGSVVHTGPGTGTCSVTIAPHVAISVAITTIGTLGTAVMQFTVGGVTSAPVQSAAGWSSTGYLVPGTYCTIVFTAGSYTLTDVYTISTLGAIAHPAGAGPAVPTFTASPVDDYTPVITCTLGGAVGTAQFTYALDGGVNSSPSPIGPVTTAAQYALPGTGLVLNFGSTFTANDTYAFSCSGPIPGAGDLTAALTALETTLLPQATYTQIVLTYKTTSAANWASTVATCETARQALFNSGIFVDFIVGGPTLGTVLPNAGSITVDVADTDSVMIAARAGMNGARPNPCASDGLMISPVTGLQFRRNCSWAAAGRSSLVSPSQDIGAVADGGLKSFLKCYRDDFATPGFYSAQITCLRTFGAGTPPMIARGFTAMASNSDYSPYTNSRVVNKACRVAYTAALPYVLAKIPTASRNAAGPGTGVIAEWKAAQIEQRLTSIVKAALVESSPQDAVNITIVVTRTNNILSTGNLIIAVSVQGYGYAVTVTLNVGMTTGS